MAIWERNEPVSVSVVAKVLILQEGNEQMNVVYKFKKQTEEIIGPRFENKPTGKPHISSPFQKGTYSR